MTTTPRLGVALTIGANATILVAIHTDPAGIETITGRLTDLHTEAGRLPAGQTQDVGVMHGGSSALTALRRRIPASAVEDLVAAVLREDR